MGDYKYKAFISYSHKDRKWTRWLHRRLETYPIPKNIIGKTTPAGIIPRRLKPIFRDREELSASNNLGEKIQAALASSKNLIIICSPAAAKSKWVNQEILTFKQNNRDAQLFSVIVEGEPYASTMPGREAEECFPPALRFEVNADGTLSDSPAEPLAADLRPHADGKRLGFLKLLSGMIGVGLDEVVQRDMKRSRKRVTAITTGSLATVLAMGTLTGFALISQKEAETQRSIAQTRTASAEELIEFMVTDLKDKLDEVGRLDALEAVAQKASDYYDQYELSEHSDDSLGRRARVFHILGEIQDEYGDLDEAHEYFMRAYDATIALLKRDPTNADRVFEHSQSSYYAGYVPFYRKNYELAEEYFKEYYNWSLELNRLKPDALVSRQELAYANTNLGVLSLYRGADNLAYTLNAYEVFLSVLNSYQAIARENPTCVTCQTDLATAFGWLADSAYKLSKLEKSVSHRREQYKIYVGLLEQHPQDAEIKHLSLAAIVGLARTEFLHDNTNLAEELVQKWLQDSKNLWIGETTNTHWLENYALFLLLSAEIKIANSDTAEAKKIIEEYDKLQIRAGTIENYKANKFNDLNIRRKKL